MKQLLFSLLLVVIAATSAQAQTKMAHINSDRIIDTLPSQKKALADLEVIQKASIAELEEMQAAFQKDVDLYNREAPGLSAALKQYREEQLMKTRQRIEQRSADLEKEMQLLNQQLFEPIEARMRKAVEIVAVRNKIAYVTEATNTWFHTGGIDITNEVIAEAMKLDAEAMKTP